MTPRITHHAIAERGKLHALGGRHVDAMLCYREAMTLAVKSKAPEVVFRHYMECAIESLERMGEHDEVIEYCDRAIRHYDENPPEHELARLDLASIHQRRGVVLLRKGDVDQARESLERASCGVEGKASLPVARTLLRWIGARMTVSPSRLEAELGRHHYYCVRRDSVSESRAAPIDHPIGGSSLLSRSEAR